jgi:hypothetical protein
MNLKGQKALPHSLIKKEFRSLRLLRACTMVEKTYLLLALHII